MPLRHGTSKATRQANINEMIAAGHEPRQAVAAAYRQQRADVEKSGHRRRHMPESSAHAPGHEISGEGGAVRQRQRMGRGEGPMHGESFGVGLLPGHAVAQHHGEHMPHDGVLLHDDHRAGPPSIPMGEGKMHASAHSHHGPHHHEHTPVPEGMRPHHVQGHHSKKK